MRVYKRNFNPTYNYWCTTNYIVDDGITAYEIETVRRVASRHYNAVDPKTEIRRILNRKKADRSGWVAYSEIFHKPTVGRITAMLVAWRLKHE